MLRDARMAVAVVEAATSHDAGGGAELADCRARAWGQVANAHRVRSEITDAERAFATASRFMNEGTGDPSLRAWLLGHLGSLHIFRRDFEAAATVLEESVHLYRDVGDRAGEASTLIRIAIMRVYSGHPGAAIGPLRRSLSLLSTREIDLLRAALQNLAHCYVELGHPQLAYAVLVEAEPHFATCTDELFLLRVQWLRGKIERDLGLLQAAEVRLGDVREGFLGQNLSGEVAVVSLDLAEVYALEGRTADLIRTIGETIPIFQGLRVTRDLLASLLKLQSLADHRDAAVALTRQIALQVKAHLYPTPAN
jgi:hypothetical protein